VNISNGVYDVTLPSNVASVPVRIITDDSNARVVIQGTDLSGTHDLSGSLSLPNTGSNLFTIQVVAPNGANAPYLLAITNPSTVILIDQAFVTANTPLVKGNSYRLVADLTMTDPFTFSPNGSGPITIEGSGHTITVPEQWPGLFSQAVTVSNLGVLSEDSTTANAGWFFASGVGGTATNCYSTGTIGQYGGGIFGDQSSGTATNCYSTGFITDGGGGIIGSNSSGTAANCYSMGAISSGGGGIIGSSSSGTATHCYSTGAIDNGAGGIFGDSSLGTATHCYSKGVIGATGGGIFGYTSNSVTATYCYSTGAIGPSGGGIFSERSSGTATNCYSTGVIGENGGGIFGSASPGTAINCYSTGTLNQYAGGIFGNESTGTPTNCYSTHGGLWSDAAANAQLTDYPGQPSPVWLRYNNVIDTPYLLVANPQPPSNNVNLLRVVVNGSTRAASNGAYAYTFNSSASTLPVLIRSQDPHAIVSLQGLSGGGNVVGNLTGLVSGANSFTIQVVSASGVATTSYPLTITRPVAGPVPCFPAGTRILTPTGYKAVETLAQNELVLTADGRQVPAKIYGKHLPVTTSGTAPYRVPKGTFGLQNDLLLSPDHAFQIRKGLWMLPKRAALLSDHVEQVGVGSPVTYYHLECPQYLRDNLVVDGAVVESYSGKQLPQSPYTYNEGLKGYTRAAPSVKRGTNA